MKSEFIHLHNHSDNSLLDGAQTINTIINTMDDLSMDSVALTEHGNLFGAISFYNQVPRELLEGDNYHLYFYALALKAKGNINESSSLFSYLY